MNVLFLARHKYRLRRMQEIKDAVYRLKRHSPHLFKELAKKLFPERNKVAMTSAVPPVSEYEDRL